MAEEVIVVSSESDSEGRHVRVPVAGPSRGRTRVFKRRIGCKNKHQMIITSDSSDNLEGMERSDDEVTVVG